MNEPNTRSALITLSRQELESFLIWLEWGRQTTRNRVAAVMEDFCKRNGFDYETICAEAAKKLTNNERN